MSTFCLLLSAYPPELLAKQQLQSVTNLTKTDTTYYIP